MNFVDIYPYLEAGRFARKNGDLTYRLWNGKLEFFNIFKRWIESGDPLGFNMKSKWELVENPEGLTVVKLPPHDEDRCRATVARLERETTGWRELVDAQQSQADKAERRMEDLATALHTEEAMRGRAEQDLAVVRGELKLCQGLNAGVGAERDRAERDREDIRAALDKEENIRRQIEARCLKAEREMVKMVDMLTIKESETRRLTRELDQALEATRYCNAQFEHNLCRLPRGHTGPIHANQYVAWARLRNAT